MNIHPIAHIRFQTLLLQLEEYNLKRFLHAVQKTWSNIPSTYRKPIVWTGKLRAISVLAVCILLATAYTISHLVQSAPAFIVFVILFCYVYAVFLTLASIVLTPVDWIIKTYIISRARRKVRGSHNLLIIGIAGSYGKTLMKEMVASVLSQKYTVLKTPENINTPVGISRLINSQLTEDINILIVEMGEYQPGDIKAICEITPPTVGIITGINQAHLERMGTIDRTISTIFELAHCVPDGDLLILNGTDKNVKMFASPHIKNKHIFWYTDNPEPDDLFIIQNYTFHQDGSGIECDIHANGEHILHVKLPTLARYAVGDALAALCIGEELRLTWRQIERGLEEVTPPPHRLQPIVNATTGLLVIDDSYNGNPDGVKAAIEVLSQFTSRRKIYITPGLVEMGDQTQSVHETIGKWLAPVADLVMLIDTSVSPHIVHGLLQSGFAKDHLIRYPDAQSLHKDFSRHLKPGDVVLFQNDWTDNYI